MQWLAREREYSSSEVRLLAIAGTHHWRCYPEVEGLRSYLDNLTFRLSAWKVALSIVLRLHCSVQLIQLQF
jgi:hypothetical protein